MSKSLKGYIFGIIAAVSYGMNPLFCLPLYADGMDPESVLFFRYLLAIPMLALVVKFTGNSFHVTRKEVFELSGMGILFAISSLSLFLSYNYMDAGIASSLLFVYPLMVAIIMACVFHEPMRWRTVGCILLALAGIGLLYRGGDGATLSLTGTTMVFLSSLSYAVYLVFITQSRLNRVPAVTVTFYVLVFGWVLFAALVLAKGSIILPSSPLMWADTVAIGLVPTAISFLCTTRALNYIGSTPTAILGALEPVTAVFFGVVIFGEALTLRILCGLVMIIVSVSLVVTASKRS